MPDKDFEQAFSSLAYAELEQKAPGLFPFLIGFQLVYKNEEGSHALGIFGFKVGDQMYYAPVFWLNGRLRGFDLLYIVSQNLFIPLQESWVNYIANKRPALLGKEETQSLAEKGVYSPDLTLFRRSPFSKVSSARPVISLKSPWPGIEDFLRHLPMEHSVLLLRTMTKSSSFAEAVYRFYPLKKITEVVASAKEIRKRAQAQPYISAKTGRSIRVITTSDSLSSSEDFRYLSAREQEDLMGKGYAIQDFRRPGEIAEAYRFPEFAKAFQTPNESGIWEIPLKDGSIVDAFVSVKGLCPDLAERRKFNIAISLDGEKRALQYDGPLVYARAKKDPDAFDNFFNKLPDATSAAVGDVGVFISDDGSASAIVVVTEKFSSDKGVSYLVDCESNVVTREKDKDYLKIIFPKPFKTTVKVVPGPCQYALINETLLLSAPRSKFLKIARTEQKHPWDMLDNKLRLQPASEADIEDILFKRGFYRIGVAFDKKAEYTISVRKKRTPMLSKISAIKQLVEKIGLREKDAEVLLNEAAKRGRSSALVKKAWGEVGPMPAFPVDQPGAYDEAYRAVVKTPDEFTQTVPTNLPPDSMYNLPDVLDSETQQKAVQAARTGQKELFDASILVGLMRSTDLADQLEDYIKDIILGNDRIGRLLFLFYAHFDQFVDRYGDEDLTELENLLKNVFQQQGDLILFLKRKSVEPMNVEENSVIAL